MTDEKAKRLLTAMASLSEGVCFVDDGDFVGFEARYASGKVRRRGGSRRVAGPYVRALAMVMDSRTTCPSWYARHFRAVPSFGSEEELELKLQAMGWLTDGDDAVGCS